MTIEEDVAALLTRMTAAEARLDQAAPLLVNARNRVSTLESRAKALGRLIRKFRGRGLDHGDPDAVPDDDDVIDIVGGQIRYGDIPRSPQGIPTGAWMLAHCLCTAHAKMRRDKTPKGFVPVLEVEPKPPEE